MSKFTIYSKDGSTARYTGEPKYSGTYMKTAYVEFSEIASPVPIKWEIGDYVDYTRTGLRYRLYSLPQPKKQGRKNEYGASFVYSNVQFYAATKELEIALFNDLVIDAEKNVHFSTRETTSTYENVYGIAKRIQASVDSFFPGKWKIQVMDLDATADAELIEILSEAKEFQASSGSCLGALNAIYNTWEGIGWIHTYDSTLEKDVITIGRPNKRDTGNTSSPFLYGLGKGLTAIQKSYTNTDEFATRLYVYGSDRNLPNRYYNGLKICNASSVDIANLMLPLSKWGKATDPDTEEQRPDASLCYIEDATKIAKYGLIPKKVYFNGGDNEEIYPSVKNMTVGRLRTAKTAAGDTDYVPSTSIYTDADERLDKVKSCVNPPDNGVSVDASDYFFEETKDISYSGGTGYIGASDNDRDTRPETYHTFVEQTLIEYTPAQAGTRVVIMPDLTVTFDASIYNPDKLKIYQSIVVKFKNTDGEVTELDPIEVQLDPGTKASQSPQYSVTLSPSVIDTEGEIVSVTVKLIFGRTFWIAKAAIFTFYSATGTIHFGFKNKISGVFQLTLKQIGFNLKDCVPTGSDGIATLSMKDGMCGGREFAVKDCVYQKDTDTWVLTAKRVKDSSVNMYYPNASFPVKEGDTFVILNIEMPSLYIGVAEETLYEYAEALYKDVSVGKAYYEPDIDAKQILKSGAVLKEGMYMQIEDEDIIDGVTDYVLIDSLTIEEDDAIPTYKVTLREKKNSSFVETVKTSLSNLSYQIRSSKGATTDIITSFDETEAAENNVFSAARSQKEFLSKKYADIANGLINFKSGLQFGDFVGGLAGFGGKIDGNADGELNSLKLRQFLEVPELRYNRVSIQVGNSWRAPGGGIIESVAPDYDADGNVQTTGVITLHLENGEPGIVAVGDLCQGIYHDGITETTNALADSDDGIGNFTFKGFFTVYFKVTEILATDNSSFRYSLRPVSTTWDSTNHPCAAMHFVAYGNVSNTSRQTSRYSTRTYERYLKDVSDWEFTKNNIGAQFGDLSNLSVFGLSMTGYSAYLNNIYMSGVISQIENIFDEEFSFSSVESSPGNPTDNPTNWHSTSTDSDIWMGIRKKTNGVWGSWEILKTKGNQGAKGDDGADGATTLFAFKAAESQPATPTSSGASYPSGWSSTVPAQGADVTPVVASGNWTQDGKTFTSDAIETGQESWSKIEFTTKEANSVVRVSIFFNRGYSSPNLGYLCKLDSEYSTSTGKFLIATSSGYLWPQTADIIVPTAGEHYFYVGYLKKYAADEAVIVKVIRDSIWMSCAKLSGGTVGTWSTPVKVSGTDGAKGDKGDKGDDGKSLYTWIRYADDASGSGISDSPVGSDGTLKKYIGFAYDKETSTESDNPNDYTWALFKGTDGDQGVPGTPGTDGKTLYTWIKYADALDDTGYPAAMYDTPTTTTEYIGIATNKETATEGTDPTAYTWSKFKGDKGVQGDKGTDGAKGDNGLSYRYSKWTSGVEYRNDNNPYYRDSNGQGVIDVVYTNAITIYNPSSGTTPPAGYVCKQTHTSGTDHPLTVGADWAQMNSMAPILTALVLANTIKSDYIDVENLAANTGFIDSLTVNRLIAGDKNGQRVEILPENKSVNIVDSDGDLVTTLEGNSYTDISSLFGTDTGSLTIINASGSDTAGTGDTVISETVLLSNVLYVAKPIKVTIGAGTINLSSTDTKYTKMDYAIFCSLKLAVYSDSACTAKIEEISVNSSAIDKGESASMSLSGISCTTTKGGYIRLYLTYDLYPVYTSRAVTQISWSGISNVTYVSEFYLARYFANGLCLGSKATNYIAIYKGDSGIMLLEAVNDGFGFKLDSNGVRYKRAFDSSYRYLLRNSTSYRGIPFNARAVGQFLLGGSSSPATAMGTYKTCDGNTISISYSSTGIYNVKTPSVWGSCFVLLTVAARTSKSNPFIVCSHNHTSTGFMISAKSSADSWLSESYQVPVNFVIFSANDF